MADGVIFQFDQLSAHQVYTRAAGRDLIMFVLYTGYMHWK